jgi:poly(3-hydroxybutyrate) depolymerase
MGVRAPLAVLAGVLGVTFVAWISGALAVHVAHAPTGCVPLRAGDRTVRLGTRDVLVHVPHGTIGPIPLVLVLHPGNESGAHVALATGLSRLADRQRFLVAYASASGPRAAWPSASSLRLRALESAACADPARLFVSASGPTARVACEQSGQAVALAVVADPHGSLPRCRPSQPLPVLEIGGSDRWLAAWQRIDGCRVRRACAAEHVRLAGGPLAARAATARAWKFFRAQA